MTSSNRDLEGALLLLKVAILALMLRYFFEYPIDTYNLKSIIFRIYAIVISLWIADILLLKLYKSFPSICHFIRKCFIVENYNRENFNRIAILSTNTLVISIPMIGLVYIFLKLSKSIFIDKYSINKTIENNSVEIAIIAISFLFAIFTYDEINNMKDGK